MDKKQSVLVVDDEPNSFDVIEAHLYREGYDLSYVSSGIQALDCLDSISPDVILLDVMMPQMDGIEVCRTIKSDPNWKHVPILMVTALTSKEDLARSLDAGADDFLPKPLSGVELRARVRSMLRIKQQYDTLQATLQLRNDLSNTIVHDLRNPLTRIMVGSSLLLEDKLDKKTLKSIELILAAGRELNAMIDDLLLMTKMESGKMLLNRSCTDINELVSQAVSEFSKIAASKNIQLKSQLPEHGYPISVDASLLRRVLDNLLSNAYKFSPRNSTITLQVDYSSDRIPQCLNDCDNTTRARPPRAGRTSRRSNTHEECIVSVVSDLTQTKATIRVVDEGSGIREDLKQRIFDKYEVGEVQTGVSQIGLGLTFCKMVVEAHGGRIFVEDNQPKGSIFTLMI
ncbi:MAG TPA: response regulator [Coleofasciculaceae cyanobacterium]